MTVRLTKKRRLPEDTNGERLSTPYGEIHLSARTLEFWRNWEPNPSSDKLSVIEPLGAALLFDIGAGLISAGFVEEINKRTGRLLRAARQK